MIKLLCILLLASTVSAGWVPDGYQTWHNGENPLNRKFTAGGTYVENYQLPNGDWAEIDTSGWVSIDDTLFTQRNAFMKTDVNKDGQAFIAVKVDGVVYTIAQRLIKLVWLNTATKNWTNIVPSANWTTPITQPTRSADAFTARANCWGA